MNEVFRIAAVIPHYRHPLSIEHVVDSVAPYVEQVIIVDDASGAESESVLQSLSLRDNVNVVRREQNGGKGAAVITGCRCAAELGFTHVFQVDADAQHDLARTEYFINTARQNPLKVVCGFPRYDDSVPKSRLWGRYVTHFLVWLNSLSFAVKDSMCGFRVYPLKPLIELIEQTAFHPRMGFDIEVVVKLHWQGVAFINREVSVYYPMDGVSHFDAVKDNLEIASTHWHLFLGMLKRSPKLVLRWFK